MSHRERRKLKGGMITAESKDKDFPRTEEGEKMSAGI